MDNLKSKLFIFDEELSCIGDSIYFKVKAKTWSSLTNSAGFYIPIWNETFSAIFGMQPYNWRWPE